MKKFESKQSPPTLNQDNGWLVQVYGRNRRLLCVLESSHGWSFVIGCGVGLLLAVVWVNAAGYAPPGRSTPALEAPTELPTQLPTFQVD